MIGTDTEPRSTMHKRFEGRVAIITGGSLGLGRAIAERLTSEGANVLLTGRNAERLDQAVAEINDAGSGQVDALVADVADRDAPERTVAAALDRWGRLDVLVNNAGIYDENGFLDQSYEDWSYVHAVLLTGPYFLAQRAAKAMMEQGDGGAIVNICSIDAHAADGPYPAYGAAKAGLMTATKYMAVALAEHRIRCNSISPGYVDTPMVASLGDAYVGMKRQFGRVPLGRLISSQEIAALCAFLASEEASAITGADHLIDGGTLADAYIFPTLDA